MRRGRKAALFRRIFVPMDGSAGALTGARRAARLALASGGRLRACYVVDDSLLRAARGIVDLREPLRQDLRTEGRRALARVERLCERLGVPCSVQLAEGDVVEQLLLAARRFRADLMVVVTRSEPGGLRALLRGSRVPPLLRGAVCPILLLPESPRARRRRRR